MQRELLGAPPLVVEALVKDANSRDDVGNIHTIVFGGIPYEDNAIV